MRRASVLALAALALALGLAAAGCGGKDEATPTPDTVVGTLPTETQPTETQPTETQPTETGTTETQPTETQPTETQPPAEGDPVAGKQVFLGPSGCGACHTLADAGTSGTVGPNLDEAKPSFALAVDRVTNGRGAMPSFKGTLSDEQIADVAAYVSSVAGK
ncbi:MAG TPA: c-type cytochrome [Gaiellaceae bacterium]|nr:c-type cytochrome [Gaiellaceae bacterium]